VQPSAQFVVIPALARKLPGSRVLIAKISLGSRLEVSAHGAKTHGFSIFFLFYTLAAPSREANYHDMAKHLPMAQ
jgi:hypothetical protein